MRKVLEGDLRGNKLRDFLISNGMDSDAVDGISLALDNYYDIENRLDELMQVTGNALNAVIGNAEIAAQVPSPSAKSPDEPIQTEAIKEIPIEPPDDLEEKDPKEVLLALMEKMDTGKGVSYSDLHDEAVKNGMDASIVEKAVKELMGEGRCYEPKIGILKSI